MDEERAGTGGDEVAIDGVFTLKRDHRNALSSIEMITFEVVDPEIPDVELTVFDAQGRRVRTLVDQCLEPGMYSYMWNGADDSGNAVANGVYVYRLEVGGHVATRFIARTSQASW